MKKWLCLMVVSMLFAGCGRQETLETVCDTYDIPQKQPMQQAAVRIPEGATAEVMQTEENNIWFCEDYVMTMQTLDAGDLDETVQTVTGFDRKRLDMIKTTTDTAERYDWVWVSAGEEGDQLCRGAILDDGNYHYVLTCMTDASKAPALQQTWQSMFDSFRLTEPGLDPYTGS